MENFEPNRDYKSLWREAKKKNDVAALENVFESLCGEIGISLQEEAEQEAAGKAAAEIMNNRGKGSEAKKL